MKSRHGTIVGGAALALVLTAGCQTVEQACPNLSQGEISALRAGLQAGRDEGLSMSAAALLVPGLCSAFADPEACATCGTALVVEVFAN